MTNATKFWNAVAAFCLIPGLFIFPWWVSLILHLSGLVGGIIYTVHAFDDRNLEDDEYFFEVNTKYPFLYCILVGGQILALGKFLAVDELPYPVQKFNNWLNKF